VRRIALLVAAIFAIPCLSVGQTVVRPTVTLRDLTANNTSASNNFSGLPNGVPAPGNVSKLPLNSLLYPGSTTRIYAHYMGWFGNRSHINIGYRSNDAAQVQKQVADMSSRGISGVVVTWNNGPETQQSAQMLLKQAELHPGFDFSLEEDVGALNTYASTVGCDVTPQVIQDLTNFYKNFEGSSAYLRINNRPVVFFFGVEKYYVDWKRVRNAVPGNPIFMIRNSGAFAKDHSDGGFSWSEQSRTNPFDEMLTYLDNFYSVALRSPGKVAFGSVYPGFNDNSASWGRNRIIHQHCAQTWLDTFAEIGRFYSAGNQLRALQIVTWNDYEEGTAVEAGIDNCVSLSTSVSGGKLSWSVTGSEQSVHHYTVFVSTDGQNLMPLADAPVGSRSLDLAPFKLAPGTYVLYVRAVGKPSILNKISDPVKYIPGNEPPHASLTVSSSAGTAPLAITASSAGSSDPDGSVASSQIDFGDGTQVDGFNAAHTYTKSGSYTVTATVFDNLGLFSKARLPVAVTPVQPGVLISAPAAGGSLSSPLQVTASAASSVPIMLMNIKVDDQVVFTTFTSDLDRSIDVTNGTHRLVVEALDNNGANLQSNLPVSLQTAGAPPAAALAVSPLAGAQSPNQVLGCTAASRDPDHNLGDSSLDFGDATPTSPGPAAVHTYGAPGTYTVTATIRDDIGLSSTATEAIFVGSGPFTLGVSPAKLDVIRGTPASYAVNVLPQVTPFNNPVTLSCSNLPPGGGCSFSASSVTPGAAGASTTMTITTGSAAAITPWLFRATQVFAFAFGLLVVGAAGARPNSRRGIRRRPFMSATLGLVFLGAVLSGCGGGSQRSAPSQPVSAGNAFTITITGSAGSTQVSTAVQLVVH